MPDEPEKKEDDPVEAIRSSLMKALKRLLRLGRQESKKTQEIEMEVEGEVHTGTKSEAEESLE